MIAMKNSECGAKQELPFTINVSHKEERDNLDQMGMKIAIKKGIHYEGYSVYTAEPYSMENAKPTLFFD
jgi:hypothetical protein